ncbi:MAG: PilT protein-like protein [Paenibacillus sp.]|nr:PilT protein-like protein [Paenibacillus sp.]
MSSPVRVMDASAVLAWLNREPGAELVAEMLLEGAVISAVNAAEVVTKLAELGASSTTVVSYLNLAGLQISDFQVEDAVSVGNLRTTTRSLGLSLGDRACVALGLKLQLPVVTTDQAWNKLVMEGLHIVQIRDS